MLDPVKLTDLVAITNAIISLELYVLQEWDHYQQNKSQVGGREESVWSYSVPY